MASTIKVHENHSVDHPVTINSTRVQPFNSVFPHRMNSEQSNVANTESAEGATNARDMEKLEEEKLKAKYPAAAQGLRAPGGHSAFLQKRLQKGVCID